MSVRQRGLRVALRCGLLMAATAVVLFSQTYLVPGRTYSRTIAGSEEAHFLFRIPTGTVARLRVDQLDGDMRAGIVSPNGASRKIDSFDFGVETITVLADVPGLYRVDIRACEPRRAVFTALLASSGPKTAADADRVAAEDLSTASKTAYEKGDLKAAMVAAQESLRAWTKVEDEFAKARTHLKVGDINFALTQWGPARVQYREAKRLCTTMNSERCIAEAANNIGLVSLNLGDVDDAVSELELARDGWKRIGMLFGEATTSSNLGLLFWQTSEWQSAIRELERARRLFRTLNVTSHARVLNNLGLVHVSMGEFDSAVRFFSTALGQSRSEKGVERDRARFRLNLGRARMLGGQSAAAIEELRRALSTFQRLNDTNGAADALNNIGQAQIRLKRPIEAGVTLEHALKLYEEVSDRRGIASALHYLGVLAVGRSALSEARTYLQRALAIRERSRLSNESAETLYQLAVIERLAGNYDESRRLIEDAIARVETLRLRVAGEPLRRTFFADKQVYSEFLIDTLLPPGTPGRYSNAVDAAFVACERARARSLLDMLGEERIVVQKAVDRELLERRRLVRRRLNYKSIQLASVAQKKLPEDEESQLRREVDELLGQNAEIEALLHDKSPAYRSIAQPAILSAQDVQQQLLADHDVLVEYSLGEARSFAWAITRTAIELVILPPRHEVEETARLVISQLGDARSRKIDPRKAGTFGAALRTLTQQLALPRLLQRGYRRLIVVPDGILHRVPFAILPSPMSDLANSSDAAYIGLQYELVQVQSASVLRALEARRQAAKQLQDAVTAFADPVFDAIDSRVSKNSIVSQKSSTEDARTRGVQLARLVFSQFEVEAIEALLPASKRTIKTAFEANRGTFLDDRFWRTPIVLVSTHAFADDIQPELSSIVLSMVDREGKRTDGYVRLYDLYALKINSSLVILSGCETAQGRQVRGEGLIGLSRGFLFAGASGLLASLSRVDEEASAALVGDFLRRHLSRPGMPPSHALLDARRAVARSPRWRDPYYWGLFTLSSGLD